MKIKRLFNLLVVLLIALYSSVAQAQNLKEASGYMTAMSLQYNEISKNFLSYTSAVAHGKNARKVENRRKELLLTVQNARRSIAAMPAFGGDKSLRDSVVAFLKINYHVLNDDYGKIVNLEEVSEQSYDAMEAYFLVQDLAGKKLQDAGDAIEKIEKAFVEKHHVNLIEPKDKITKKMEQVGKVNDYHRKLYLIFFKSYKQESYLLDALDKKNLNGVEQNRNSLVTFSEEGIKQLLTIPDFNGDNGLKRSCRQLLEFYNSESKDKIPHLTNYNLKEETFQKLKKAFDSKKESERTEADINEYNKAINDINQAVKEYNAVNKQINASRATSLDNWNKESKNFLDKYTPHQK